VAFFYVLGKIIAYILFEIKIGSSTAHSGGVGAGQAPINGSAQIH
tara:strand:- start:163 stop:297 length:135 start_codon:yes stop_codon:yes gene_type:complete